MKSSLASTCLPLFCAALILASCTDLPDPSRDSTPAPTPLPFSCDMFTEDHWRELEFGVDTPEKHVETVERVWGIDLRTMTLVRYGKAGQEDFRGWWNADSSAWPGSSYRVRFDRAAKLSYVGVYWDREDVSHPTLIQVLDCMGVPDYYIAAFVEDRRDWLKFSLWYVDKGFVIQGSSFRSVFSGLSNWSSIESKTLMGDHVNRHQGDFIVVASGSLEQMVSDVYGPLLQDWELCLIRPWPGSIEAIDILSFEEYLRCAT